ncbi:MAG: complex I NDUFA9 subunit family protein [Robiginitomaculum sp.]
MPVSHSKLVVVFGGSGFVGRQAVRALVKDGWRVRVATRRPHVSGDLRVIGATGQVQLVQVNIRHKLSVERALIGADAVVNLVSVLYQSGRQNFNALNIMGVSNIAEAARDLGISNMVQISAIGADPQSASEYSASKGEGEAALRALLPSAAIVRPSIIFGEGDGFFNKFASLASLSPVLPLFGGGETKFQPVYVGDVARAIAAIIGKGSAGQTYELGGPRTYSFKELLRFTADAVDRKRFYAPIPWPIANLMGLIGEISGKFPFVTPFLTRDQVKDLRSDNVVSDSAKDLSDLNIRPESIEAVVPDYLKRYRKAGQFHKDADAIL